MAPRFDVDGARLPPIRLSDRWLQRLRRLVAGHPYLAGSLVFHAALVAVLMNVAAFDAQERARVAAADKAKAVQRVADTQAHDLQRRVERLAAIHAELAPDAAPLPPIGADGSPQALAARAQALADAIDAADLAARATDLARLTGLAPDAARRKLEAEAAAQRPPPPPESAAQKIARLERHARDLVEARRARLDAQRDGVRVASARPHAKAHRIYAPDQAPPPTAPASGSTGQVRVADGIPRSMSEQLKSMLRLGGPQGRVGVNGTEAGLSVNREHVRGIAGGRNATEDDFGRDGEGASKRRAVMLEGQREQSHGTTGRIGDHGPGVAPGGTTDAAQPRALPGLAAVRIPGNSLDLTGRADDGKHDLVRYASPPAVSAGSLHTAAGRVFGAGGTYADRVYLDSWYVIGPFAGRGDESMQAAYPPEDDVDLDAAYAGPDGRTLTWQFTSRGFYPFIPPDRAENAVYYAYTELRVDEDRDVWMAIAADDDSMMWLDERVIWVSAPGDKPWYHPPYYLRDELGASLSLAEGQRRVHLAPGVHRLLFKLYNNTDKTFFSVVLSP